MMSWYRSLYWRIAIGFVVGLAAMLVVQAVLFIWVASLAGPAIPGRPPERFAQTLALDIGSALERESALNIATYIEEQYGRVPHPFFVMRADGSVFSHGGPFPEPFLAQARVRLARGVDDRGGRGARYGRGEREGFRGTRPVPIVVRGQLAGVVTVLPRAPFGFLLRRYAPTLGLVAAGVLVVGGALATIVIFGPARRRLRAVEDAARRLGAGDLTARVPDTGQDEVAAVAAAFNAMADDLAARAGALASADRTRRQLLADVSHELTTPVTAMRGYLETLTIPTLAPDEATRARYLNIIGEETARLERIIGDLLDLARLEGGGGALVFTETAVAPLFDRVVSRHERACRERSVIMRTAIDPRIVAVRGDGDRLEQALQNLAANAIRYAPRGSTIELRAHRENATITFAVSDEGPGIAPDHLPHVFDRFYKAEAARSQAHDSGSGSGLGLSIAKAIVERHGGRITVESEPGRTTFTIAGLQDCRIAEKERVKEKRNE